MQSATRVWVGRMLVAACAAVVFIAAPARAATSTEVNDAVAKAVNYLYDVQQDANWELVPAPTGDESANVRGKQWGGLTAMATYALLAAGENPQDPRLAKAINWLLDADLVGTYAIGLRAQVWQFLPEKHPQRVKIKAAIRRDRDLLALGVSAKKDDSFGFYSYFAGGGGYDLSNSQYGVLGMWAAEQAGAEIPRRYWEIQDQSWKQSQQQDGGWAYRKGDEVKATMTAAGVATLFITQDYLLDLRRDCQGNYFNQNIEMGLSWMDRHVNELLGGNYYGMYGVERIGVASGRKYFGAVDWYQTGSDFLVKHQGGDGAWGGEDDNHNARKIPNTCFSLYFLTRGRAPVIMNKLDYTNYAKEGKETGWNQRPRDLANFCKWMTRNLDGRFTNWQVVTLKAQPHELHDAPILYMAGSEAFNLSQGEVDKLRLFVEQGGLILGNSDCGNAKFTRSFTNLGNQLFKNEFRELEITHPIFSGQQFNATKWRKRPRVLAMSNGVREQMLLVPNDDLSKAWQTRSDRTKEELYQLTANIFLYLVRERTLAYKGDTYVVRDNPEVKVERAIKVARLEYPGNWNPEPGGWRRLATIMKNAGLASIAAEPVKLGGGKLKDYKVAHLTGTTRFKLNDAARKEIKAFADAGGTLLIDAAGGADGFADSALDELAAIFGEPARKAASAPLAPGHRVFTLPELGIAKFDYRSFARGKRLGRLNTPRLGAVEVNGRVVAFFSREDLSGSLVGQPVDGILGYSPETATQIARNVLVYAYTGGKGFPPKPKDPPKEGRKHRSRPGTARRSPQESRPGPLRRRSSGVPLHDDCARMPFGANPQTVLMEMAFLPAFYTPCRRKTADTLLACRPSEPANPFAIFPGCSSPSRGIVSRSRSSIQPADNQTIESLDLSA